MPTAFRPTARLPSSLGTSSASPSFRPVPAAESHPVRIRRVRANLTQAELAQRANLSVGSIAALEEGRVRRVNPRLLHVLGNLTQIAPDDLQDEVDRWSNEDILSTLPQRARNTLSLPVSVVAQYTSFSQWRAELAPTPTAFASLLRVSRLSVAKLERGDVGIPKPIEHALATRLGVSPEYIEELRRLA
jgi:transcriptional regulator with XRE-family HTH domain